MEREVGWVAPQRGARLMKLVLKGRHLDGELMRLLGQEAHVVDSRDVALEVFEFRQIDELALQELQDGAEVDGALLMRGHARLLVPGLLHGPGGQARGLNLIRRCHIRVLHKEVGHAETLLGVHCRRAMKRSHKTMLIQIVMEKVLNVGNGRCRAGRKVRLCSKTHK